MTIGFTLLRHSFTFAEEVYALLPQLKTRNLRESLFQPFLEESRNVDK